MTQDELGELQDAYGSEWFIRIQDSRAKATRLRGLSDEELGAGMHMTLMEGDANEGDTVPLAEKLAKQDALEKELAAAAVA